MVSVSEPPSFSLCHSHVSTWEGVCPVVAASLCCSSQACVVSIVFNTPLWLSPLTFSAAALSSKWSLPTWLKDLLCLQSYVVHLDSSTSVCHYSHCHSLVLSYKKWIGFFKFFMIVPFISLTSIWFYSSPSNFHHDLASTFCSVFSPAWAVQ